MSLQVRCAILKRIVILLSAYELVALALGSVAVGAKDFQSSIIYYSSMIVSFAVSYELNYSVTAMIIRLELNKKNKKKEEK